MQNAFWFTIGQLYAEGNCTHDITGMLYDELSKEKRKNKNIEAIMQWIDGDNVNIVICGPFRAWMQNAYPIFCEGIPLWERMSDELHWYMKQYVIDKMNTPIS